jgi:hypothetical protein
MNPSSMPLDAAVVAAAILWVCPASAAAVSFGLTWDAPAECPDVDYVRAQIATLLADAPPTAAQVNAHAVVAERADGLWTVRLATDRNGTAGERSFEADSCRSLADATALIVALTIDPAHVAAVGAASAPAPEPAAPEPAAPEPAAPSAVPPPLLAPIPPPTLHRAEVEPRAGGSSLPPLRFSLDPAIDGDVGTLPHLAYGFSLAASVLVGRFRGEVYGAYWPDQTANGPPGTPAGDGGTIELFDGGLRGCFAPLLKRVELSACAGFEAGALHGAGVNLTPRLTPTGPWLAVTLDARVVVRLSKVWGIALDAGAAIPLRRDEFTFGTGPAAPTVHEAGVIEGRGSIGPELRF